jgi:hypothetical protein
MRLLRRRRPALWLSEGVRLLTGMRLHALPGGMRSRLTGMGERGTRVGIPAQWPGHSQILRMAAVVLHIRGAVAARRRFMLGLKGRAGHVLIMFRLTLFRRGIMMDAARAAAIGYVAVANHRGPVDNGPVNVCGVNEALIDVDHGRVVGEFMAAPYSPREPDPHIAESIVDAAVIADVRSPISVMENK